MARNRDPPFAAESIGKNRINGSFTINFYRAIGARRLALTRRSLRDIPVKTTNKILISAMAAAVLSGGLFTETVTAMAAAVLSGGLFTETVTAMAPTSLPASDTTAAAPTRLQVAAVVCGSVGCAPVTTKATPRRKLKWLGHG
jgi:hypothetical protein